MEIQYLTSFQEEFFDQFELFVNSAKDLYQSNNPNLELKKIKKSIHTLRSTCMMLNIDNLTDFFRAFEDLLEKIILQSKNIPPALHKALDIGYNKFQEINAALQNGKPSEKIKKLNDIETLIEVESFYSYNNS